MDDITVEQELHLGSEALLEALDGNYDLLERRVAELESKTTKTTLGPHTVTYSDYIHPETNMEMGLFLSGKPFHIDDPEIPMIFAENFAKIVESSGTNDKINEASTYISMVLGAVQATANIYFTGDGTAQQSRFDLMQDLVTFDSGGEVTSTDFNSIKDFKGVAECFEIAALAHNCFKIAGVDSSLAVGSLERTRADKPPTNEGHVFIILRSPSGKYFLFDPANPGYAVTEDGTFGGYRPNFTPIEEMIKGDRVQVTLRLGESLDQSNAETEVELTYELGTSLAKE